MPPRTIATPPNGKHDVGPSPTLDARGSWTRWVPLVLLILASVTALPEVFTVLPRAIWLTCEQGAQTWPSAAFRRQMDQLIAEFPREGDAYLHTNITPREAERAGMIYFYSAYSLFPRRLRASQEPRVINGGNDLLPVASPPTPEWLRQEEITAILLLVTDESGQLQTVWLPTDAL